MREKLLVTDPMDPLFAPKTLESFLSQKRTAQTGFHIAARFTSGEERGLGTGDDEVRLWFSRKYAERIDSEVLQRWPDSPCCDIKINSWRMEVMIPTNCEGWEYFKAVCKERGYDLTPVRSFRRFTR